MGLVWVVVLEEAKLAGVVVDEEVGAEDGLVATEVKELGTSMAAEAMKTS
jgi:hypothetical protein